MAKKKLDVSEREALRHSPFGALSGASAPHQAPMPAVTSASEAPAKQKSRGRLVQRRETKGRGGKAAVVIAGLRANAHLSESEIEKLAQELKRELGSGGAVQRVPNDTEIVIQGDQPSRVAALLRALGFRVDGVT